MSGHTPWRELTAEVRADPRRRAEIAAERLRIEREVRAYARNPLRRLAFAIERFRERR